MMLDLYINHEAIQFRRFIWYKKIFDTYEIRVTPPKYMKYKKIFGYNIYFIPYWVMQEHCINFHRFVYANCDKLEFYYFYLFFALCQFIRYVFSIIFRFSLFYFLSVFYLFFLWVLHVWLGWLVFNLFYYIFTFLGKMVIYIIVNIWYGWVDSFFFLYEFVMVFVSFFYEFITWGNFVQEPYNHFLEFMRLGKEILVISFEQVIYVFSITSVILAGRIIWGLKIFRSNLLCGRALHYTLMEDKETSLCSFFVYEGGSIFAQPYTT